MTTPTLSECRPEVQEFALLMEEQLRDLKWTGRVGWQYQEVMGLEVSMLTEVLNFRISLSDWSDRWYQSERGTKQLEESAADIAIHAMRIVNATRRT